MEAALWTAFYSLHKCKQTWCVFTSTMQWIFSPNIRRTGTNTEGPIPMATQKEDLTETRHFYSRLRNRESQTRNQGGRPFALEGNKKVLKMGELTKEHLNDPEKQHIKTKGCCMHSEHFSSEELHEASQRLRTARRSYWKSCTTKSKKVFKKQQGTFKSLLKENSNNWTNSLSDEINEANVHYFWYKLGKLYKTDMSHGLAPMNNESGYFLENNEKTELLRETFFTGMHLTYFNFDNAFYESINEEMKQLSVQAGEESQCCNNPWAGKKQTTQSNNSPLPTKLLTQTMFTPECWRKMNLIQGNSCFNCSTSTYRKKIGHRKPAVIFLRKPRKTDYSKLSSFHPTKISSYVGELFERTLESRVRALAEQVGVLFIEQSGFWKHKSTVRLLCFVPTDKWMQKIDGQKATRRFDVNGPWKSFRLCLGEKTALEV